MADQIEEMMQIGKKGKQKREIRKKKRKGKRRGRGKEKERRQGLNILKKILSSYEDTE